MLKLRMSKNHETIGYLMNSLVDLVGPKVNSFIFFCYKWDLFSVILRYIQVDITLCLNVLKSMLSQESALVKLIGIKLMTKLCVMKLDYLAYPLFSKELMILPQKSDPHRLEEIFTKAYCIFEIVSYRFVN